MTVPIAAIYGLWFFWLASWMIAALWSKPAVKRPLEPAELISRLISALGFGALLALDRPEEGLAQPFWITPEPLAWALVGMTFAGFAFCWWARLHLGTLWSASVTIKADHKVIDTGPYRLVRHPIYTGILVAAVARLLLYPTPWILVGLALLTFGFWMKARVEERFLSAELDPDAYGAYARRTKMLIPFVL